MKACTEKLSGKWLDYAVARALNLPLCREAIQPDSCVVGTGYGDLKVFAPSSDWRDAGPLISQCGINLAAPIKNEPVQLWRAFLDQDLPSNIALGATPLLAASRAIVLSKIGTDVEIPE